MAQISNQNQTFAPSSSFFIFLFSACKAFSASDGPLSTITSSTSVSGTASLVSVLVLLSLAGGGGSVLAFLLFSVATEHKRLQLHTNSTCNILHLRGFSALLQGAEIRPHSQLKIATFFPNTMSVLTK